jgi:hypothetical protein
MTDGSSWPVAHATAADVVSLFLAGFLSQGEASKRLGLDVGDLEIVLEEVGLARVALVPVEVDDGLDTYYLDIGRSEFAAPLFDDVVHDHRRAAGSPGSARLRLPATSVLGAAAPPPSACPGGLMFHVGRCGSTLLCNLLANVDGWVAVKEPEFVNAVLLGLAAERDTVSRARLSALAALLLRSLAYGVRVGANGRERACVVKFTSWNLLFADDLIGWLDAAPLVVVTRDPWATVASLLHDPPYWYAPPALSPSEPRPCARARRVEAVGVFAEAWSRTVDRALQLPAERTLLVSYADLVQQPLVMLGRVLRHLGDDRPVRSTQWVDDVMGQYSKGTTGERFEPRARHYRGALDPEERDLVTTITAETWSDLAERTLSPALKHGVGE